MEIGGEGSPKVIQFLLSDHYQLVFKSGEKVLILAKITFFFSVLEWKHKKTGEKEVKKEIKKMD